MPLVINTNVASLLAQQYLNQNTTALDQSYERLSSGYRINTAADDPTGLQISDLLQAQIQGSQMASQNTQEGINVLSIADGALSTIETNLQNIRALAVEAANDTNSALQRSAIANQINATLASITSIANSTSFNGVFLLNGTAGSYRIEVGSNSTSNSYIDVSSALTDCTSSGLGLATSISANTGSALSSNGDIQTYIASLDTALAALDNVRSLNGSFVDQLQDTSSNLSTLTINLQSTNSLIRDTDVAAETSNMTQEQILQQAATTVLTQANQMPNLALTLLKGGQ